MPSRLPSRQISAGLILQLGQWGAETFLARIVILSWFFWCMITLLQPALLVGWLVLVVMGIIHAANGEWKTLPGVGHFTLIK
jgi:uncharacterized Tic20 family protein